jgi:hypothetical protein
MTIEQALTNLHALQWDNSRAKEIAEEVMCHSRMDKSCAKLLLKQHPSEDDHVFNWRKNNFAHITYPLFLKAKNSIYKIFQTADHRWVASTETTQYLKDARFGHGKGLLFDTFIQQYCLQAMIEDPNAWLVIVPKFPTPPPNQSVDVNMKIIWSKNQLYADEDLIIFADKMYSGFNKNVESGYAIDRERVVRFVKNTNGYTITDQHFHELGEIPYTVLGGNMTTDGVFTSFFQPFVEYANQALMFYSEWQVTKSSCAFPIKEMEEIECPTCHGNGKIYLDDGGFDTCGSCKGTGIHNYAFSPATIFIRRKSNPGEPEKTRPMLEYISPPVDIIQEQKADWQLMLTKALESLNLQFVDEAQSGIAKEWDRAEFYSFLMQIADMLFGNVEYSALNYIERMRRFNTAEPVLVIKPTTFTIETKADLTDDLLKSVQSPFDPLRADSISRLQKHINANDPIKIKINDFLIRYDPLYLKTTAETSIYVDTGVMTQDEAGKSTHAYSELLKLIDEEQAKIDDNLTNWFLDSSYDTIATALDARIAAILARKEQETADVLQSQFGGTAETVSSTAFDLRS